MYKNSMKIIITGSDGFVGKNLTLSLNESSDFETVLFNRDSDINFLQKHIQSTDLIVHLAGENRPNDESMFQKVNVGLSQEICDIVLESKKKIPIIFSSSTQVHEDNEYGRSKLEAENIFEEFSKFSKIPVIAIRFCGIFGKWSKPNYNSVIATFCNNIANGIPINVSDPDKMIKLSYIDDVISMIKSKITNINKYKGFSLLESEVIYEKNLGYISETIASFRDSRNNLLISKVGAGFERALYSTYLSFLKPENFIYDLKENKDERGVFVEMLKTSDSGQFSFFTAHPGITRGGHYHHSKNEKFLVLKGEAKFSFRNIINDEKYHIFCSDKSPQVIDTVPGWSHDIKNIGNEDMIVMLWANEIFDKDNPDTIAYKI